ncbi:ABC transporter ATP-binding protein [Paracoccus stylophorae]|uniref:Spermidine/putrescine import ATP-binding protein PotA n=1 Tax=Paracoccus stylophorae TaxID=659350 RepID=A0ABY7SVE6_9RHOB|nr:ABC transporter ATP-binding protein [Paracoccus stylophorae]WCR10869.1 ABC transporter ATP-binding protein [Paracoccus stylophorae]
MTDATPVFIDAASKRFGRGPGAVDALQDVSLTIEGGSFFTLLGPSGCGKTTLLRLLAGFETPTHGRILLGDQDVTALPPNRRPINTVFQSYALFPHLTVARNVGFGLKMQGIARAQLDARVDRMLALVRMQDFADRPVAQLSGGQQQRVALARALAPEPRVLLLDEPLSALDLKLRKEMQIELKRLQRETGITFVFVTHDQEEALTMSDRIAVMSAGRVQQIGTPREIYAHPANRFVAGFIGESNFLPVTIADGAARIGDHAVTLSAPAGPGKATLAIRPEDILVDPAATLSAEITDTVYLGNAVQIMARLDDGTRIALRQPAGADLPANGQRIGLRLPPAAIRILEPE